ncbi:MAG TPA: acyl carrier protein [Hyphomicrobiales bacterium]|nr:acyl carrier protein [Hyphomicrobiales bacterium]
MSVRLTVISEIENVAQEQGKPLKALSDDLALENTGLDSLCWAIIVARLESSLGIDPFTASEEVYFPVTVGEFVNVYEQAAQ